MPCIWWCSFLCICWCPTQYFLKKLKRIQQSYSVVGGHFAVVVAIIIIQIINDLPALQDTSSRIRYQAKNGRNAFRALLYEFTLLIAFLFLEMQLLWNYWDQGGKHVIKKVSCRVGKCDKSQFKFDRNFGVFWSITSR